MANDLLELTTAAPVLLELFGVGTQGPPGPGGFPYNWLTSTAATDPGAGAMKVNNATLASATALYISETDAAGRALASYIATWDDSPASIKGRLTFIDAAVPGNFAVFDINGALTDNGTWVTLPIVHVAHAGTFTAGEALFVQLAPVGPIGATGPISGPGTTVVDRVVTWNSTTGLVVKDSGVAISALATTASILGKHSIWMPAAAMTPRITNGPPLNSVELATNKIMLKTLDFDTTTQEFAQFAIRMPKSWNKGTLTFIPVWSHAATATNFGVVWGLQAVAISDNEAADAAFGTVQTSTDTGGTTNNVYQGPESAAITVAGTIATGDLVIFQVYRDPANGSDTLAIDARLHGVLVLYTVDQPRDD